MGNDQAFIFADVGVLESITNAPGSLAKLRLTYKNPRPDGLPTGEEYEPVKKIEDSLGDFAEQNGDWYVGRVSVGGYRIFYTYTDHDEDDWQEFTDTLSETSEYEIRLSFKEDKEHSEYHKDLYPTDADWQVIQDLKVIDSLKEHGDDGTETRKIDHWIYFPNKQSSTDFIAWAENHGFTEDSEHSNKTDDGEYCVRLYHTGTVNLSDITNHTIKLQAKAKELGGNYDGWETPVITD